MRPVAWVTVASTYQLPRFDQRPTRRTLQRHRVLLDAASTYRPTPTLKYVSKSSPTLTNGSRSGNALSVHSKEGGGFM